jgi:putative endopeptidase
MKKTVLLAAAAASLLSACATTPPAQPASSRSGIALGNIDQSVRPQDDLYRHTNGLWLKRTEIPADRSNFGRFTQLADEAEVQLRAIIEEAASKKDQPAGSDAQKVGDLYASFMNEARLEELGLKPLAAEMARIDALKKQSELSRQFAHFARTGVASPVFYYIGQDDKQATQYIAFVAQAAPYSGAQSGLGLPDRDYYLSDDAKFKDLRAKYVAHVEKMLSLAGVDNAARAAQDILALETEIAKIHWTRVADRDSEKTYNKYRLNRLKHITSAFDWDGYIKELGIEKSPGLVVRQPDYFANLAKLMGDTPMEVWRPYLKMRLLSAASPYLNKAFVDENFAFYGATLRGIQENRPRWKRGVAAVENSLGEVLGKIYVERHFPPEAKTRMEGLVKNLMVAYEQSIKELDWMSATTKKKALAKLAKFNPKIGYPNKWRDYSALTIAANDLIGNIQRSTEVEFQRERAKLGAPIDRDEWGMTPQTVNAYYNPGLNEIVFPAAILQPPFFNLQADDAVNYGGIGAVIGHEIGHGFDDEGSKYDGDGNLKSWWTEKDRKAFEERTKALIAQYDAFCPLEGHCVSGALTIGENIGDLGGLSIALKAYKLALAGQEDPVIDGFTGEQRVLMGWAQVWARKYREQELLNRLKTDPHSPSEYRANGTVMNIPEFHSAFGVKEGDKMWLAPEKRVKIW